MFDGSIAPLTARLALPMLIGQLLQVAYMIIDTAFIARIDPTSTALLSGTGLAFPLFFLFMAIGVSINVGVSTLMGRMIGEKRADAAQHVLASGLLIASVIIAPVLALGYPFGHTFLHVLAGSRLSDQAVDYGLRFYYFLLPGFGLMLLGQAFFGILQGEGRTDTIARIMVISTLLNIVLDPILIFILHMGVAGAGLATSLSVLISMVYGVLSLKKGGSHLTLTINLFNSQKPFIREIIRIGFPNLISMAAMSISFMILNKLVGGIGQVEMNAWTMVGRMDQIVLIPSFAISGATVAMISQNFGRGNLVRVRKIYRMNILLGMGVVTAVALLYMIVTPFLFPFFSTVTKVVSTAVFQVRVVSLSFTGVCAAIISTAAFQATGKPLPALVISFFRMGIISIPLAVLMAYTWGLGYPGILFALAAGNLAVLPIAFGWTRLHLKRLHAQPLIRDATTAG